MVNTLQLDRLARITGFSGSHPTTQFQHRPHALNDAMVLDGGRGETMSDLLDENRELPINVAIHTDTYMRTNTKVQNKTKHSKRPRIGDLTLRC